MKYEIIISKECPLLKSIKEKLIQRAVHKLMTNPDKYFINYNISKTLVPQEFQYKIIGE